MIEQFFFIIFAVVAVLSSLAVVMLRNPVHCAIYLMVALLQVAALFLLLRAPFLAVVQVFIYVGAVMVLFLFAVFLLDVRKAMMEFFRPGHRPWAIIIVAIVLIETLMVIAGSGLSKMQLAENMIETSVEGLGRALFTDFIFPFEIVSVVLLVAMVGAIVMAKAKDKS